MPQLDQGQEATVAARGEDVTQETTEISVCLEVKDQDTSKEIDEISERNTSWFDSQKVPELPRDDSNEHAEVPETENPLSAYSQDPNGNNKISLEDFLATGGTKQEFVELDALQIDEHSALRPKESAPDRRQEEGVKPKLQNPAANEAAQSMGKFALNTTNLDEDGDGKVSLEEFIAAGGTREQFNAIDADGDGTLTTKELKTYRDSKGIDLRNMPVLQKVAMWILPPITCMVVAIAFGLAYNTQFYGGPTGGEPTTNALKLTSVNLLVTCCVSAIISSIISLARLAMRLFAPKSLYSVFTFSAYAILTSLYLSYALTGSVAVMVPQAAGISNQMIRTVDDHEYYEHGEGAMRGFVDLFDVYKWLRGSVKDIAIGDVLNRDPSVSPGSYLNAPMQLSNYTEGWANWVVINLRIRQVRVELQDMDPQGTVDPAGQPGLTFNKRIPQYTSSVQNKKTRTFADHAGASYTETYHDNKFMNSWGQNLEAPDLTVAGSSTGGFMFYPGKSGQTLTSSNPFGIQGGSWRPLTYTDSTAFSAAMLADLDFMESSGWIDHLTAFLTVELAVWNPNNNLFVSWTYPIEFLNSGQMILSPPYAGTNKVVDDPYPAVYIPLIWAFYFFNCELQDLVIEGAYHYFYVMFSYNLVDVACVGASFAMSCTAFTLVGTLPAITEPSIWPATGFLVSYQRAAGIALFCAVFKVLQFTRKIPVMCHVGRTFTACALDISLFLVVMFVLFFAFAMVFYANFRLTMPAFANFSDTIFYVFRGLQGEMDADALVLADPFIGPIVYSLYVTILLYVSFTLLIGMVCAAYDDVRNEDAAASAKMRNKGLMVTLFNHLATALAPLTSNCTGTNKADDEATDKTSTPVAASIDRTAGVTFDEASGTYFLNGVPVQENNGCLAEHNQNVSWPAAVYKVDKSLSKDQALAQILQEIQQTKLAFNTTFENLKAQVIAIADLQQEESEQAKSA